MTRRWNGPISDDGIRAVMQTKPPKPHRIIRRCLVAALAVLAFLAAAYSVAPLLGQAIDYELDRVPTAETAGRWDVPPPPESKAPITLQMTATAYTYGCGNGDGVTATGTIPRPGVAAVDPAVIPLGTELYVEGYGYARAEDTGGAIRGARIDLFFPTRETALQWGRRTVEVRVLKVSAE